MIKQKIDYLPLKTPWIISKIKVTEKPLLSPHIHHRQHRRRGEEWLILLRYVQT